MIRSTKQEQALQAEPRVFSTERLVRVRGRRACFTDPAFRTERFSAVIPSVSGWEGILSQIMGHKGTRYHVTWAALLFKPRWHTVTSNELSTFGAGRLPIDTMAPRVRTLRATSFLAGNLRTYQESSIWSKKPVKRQDSGVDYVACFRMSAPASEFSKLDDILARRLKNGHFWRQPYLGIRECGAFVEQVEDLSSVNYPEMDLVSHANGVRAADVKINLGFSFYGTDWSDSRAPNFFYPMEIQRGLLIYPSWEEVRKLGIRQDVAS